MTKIRKSGSTPLRRKTNKYKKLSGSLTKPCGNRTVHMNAVARVVIVITVIVVSVPITRIVKRYTFLKWVTEVGLQ